MWHPFDPPMDPIPSQNTQTRQKAQKPQRSWKATSTFFIILACAVYLLLMYGPRIAPQKDLTLGGDEGILQDGVYYVYAGGGFSTSYQSKPPIGLCTYTPGQEPEVLVSAQDYTLITFPDCWDVNSHGLYFADRVAAVLYRMDLETRQITPLYTLPDAPEDGTPYLFLNGLWEDRVALICHDGVDTCHLVLDCRTGEVLSKEPGNQGKSWNLVTGERTLVQHQMDYPTGTEYPDWERDVKDGLYYYNDLRENGVSVLPQGHQLEEAESRSIGDAVLVISHPFEDQSDLTYRLFLADGTTLDLPKDTREDAYYTYLAVSGKWLFYTDNQKDPTPNMTKWNTELRVMDLETGESYLVSTEHAPYHAVTDGTWFYTCGDTTDCYQLDYNDQGIPCGLTLIEKNI